MGPQPFIGDAKPQSSGGTPSRQRTHVSHPGRFSHLVKGLTVRAKGPIALGIVDQLLVLTGRRNRALHFPNQFVCLSFVLDNFNDESPNFGSVGR